MTTKDTSDWHAITQNDEYLRLLIQRLSKTPLIWVNQFTQIINDFIGGGKGKYVLNDIGCNVGHFARNTESINSDIAYRGIDISKTYIEIAKNHFPKLDFYVEDFAHEDLNISHFNCDISLISSTLEHIDDYEQFLSNVFKTTNQMVLIRTMVGKTSEKDYCLREGAKEAYIARQFTITDLVNKKFNKDWLFEIIIDEATQSKSKFTCNSTSIARTQFIIKFIKI